MEDLLDRGRSALNLHWFKFFVYHTVCHIIRHWPFALFQFGTARCASVCMQVAFRSGVSFTAQLGATVRSILIGNRLACAALMGCGRSKASGPSNDGALVTDTLRKPN